MFGRPPYIEQGAPWSLEEISRTWRALSTRAERQIRRGTRSGGFEAVLAHARKLLKRGDLEALESAMEHKRFCRAVVMLWSEDPELAYSSVRAPILDLLSSGPHPLSRMAVSSLVNLHLQHFSRLNQWEPGLFSSLAATISGGIAKLNPIPGREDIVESVAKSPHWFLHDSGPEAVARELMRTGHNFDDFLTDSGLRGFDGGDYGGQVRLWYYIEQIREADPTRDHAFLSELTQKSVYKAPVRDGYFGHKILEALAFKDHKPSDAWLDTILAIAGDPRLEHSRKWFEWWKPIDPHAMDTVKAWLSTQDLRLFLAAVEEYALREGDLEIQRMFPDRKRFLEGLLALGLVKETRLILGHDARRYVEERLGSNLKSDVADLRREPQRSVIYVDCGSFHLVEGSHSFKIWVYVGNPSKLLIDRSKRVFSGKELRQVIPDTFLEQNDWDDQKFDGYSHHYSEYGTWQFKVINFLGSHGIRLPYKELVMPSAIANYVRRNGLPAY